MKNTEILRERATSYHPETSVDWRSYVARHEKLLTTSITHHGPSRETQGSVQMRAGSGPVVDNNDVMNASSPLPYKRTQ